MKRFLLTLVALLLTSCGTDTGNPGFGPGVPASGTGGTTFMVPAMCNKLVACFPSLSFNQCYSGVYSSTGLTGAMGLNTATYPDLNTAYAGVVNGALHVNQTNLDQCSTAISSLSCVDPLVTGAYSVGAPTNFNNTYRVLSASASCQNSISP